MRLDVWHHSDDTGSVEKLTQEIKAMSAAMDRLKVEVAETRGIIPSVRALVQGLQQQIRDLAAQVASMDPTALEAELTTLADDLDASQGELGVLVQSVPQPAPPVGSAPAQPVNEAGFPIGGGASVTPGGPEQTPVPAPPPTPLPEPTPMPEPTSTPAVDTTAPANVAVQPVSPEPILPAGGVTRRTP